MLVSTSLTFHSDLIAIRVHGGHDVNPSVVHQLSDLRVGTIVMTQIFDEIEQQLSSHHLISMHVAHILELWFP